MDNLRYVPAWDMGRRDMGAHWVREGSAGNRDDTLDALMSVDHVVRVMADGTVTDNAGGVYAPETHIDTDADGQILGPDEKRFIDRLKGEGWTVETGWSSQNSGRYGGPIMHSSEFIGGDPGGHNPCTPGYLGGRAGTTGDHSPGGR